MVYAGYTLEEQQQAAQADWARISIEEHVAQYVTQGMSEKDAMKQAAKDRGVSKRDIYNHIHQQTKKEEDR